MAGPAQGTDGVNPAFPHLATNTSPINPSGTAAGGEDDITMD